MFIVISAFKRPFSVTNFFVYKMNNLHATLILETNNIGETIRRSREKKSKQKRKSMYETMDCLKLKECKCIHLDYDF